jgi:hypothetical protein
MINESIEEHLRIARARPGFAGSPGAGQPAA